MNLPIDFGLDTRRKAANCPYVLDSAPTKGHAPGQVVYGHDIPDIESGFGPGVTKRLYLLGYTLADGLAVCIDRDGDWWVVSPEALALSPEG